jgi:hypothetical protein
MEDLNLDNSLLQILTTETDENLHHLIEEYLKHLSVDQQLDHLIDLFQSAADHQQIVHEAIIAAWAYLVEKNIWITRYPTLAALQLAIHYDDVIKPILDNSRPFATRTIGAYTTIYRNWEILPSEVFPRDIRPPYISQHILKQLARISTVSSFDNAIRLIREQIRLRLSHFRKRKSRSPCVRFVDLLKAYERLNPPSKDTESPLQVLIPSRNLRHRPPVQTAEEMDEIIASSPQQSDLLQEQPFKQRRICTCSHQLPSTLININPASPSHQRLRLFSEIYPLSIPNICWDHIRLLARLTLGLISNGLTFPTLKARMSYIYHNINDYDIILQREANWFNKETRSITPQEKLMPYRYFAEPLPDPVIDIEAIFSRLAGPTMLKEWKKQGTIIIPDFFSFLNDEEIRSAIDFEFNLYKHHFKPNTQDTTKGFLRNMFYSPIQQLVRQYPAWYAIQVAARPDHAWRLITYPYVAKFIPQLSSDDGLRDASMYGAHKQLKTGFEHMDINIKKFYEEGIGASQLTSSLSLDNETKDGCTVIVPQFFDRCPEWYEEACKNKTLQVGVTTNGTKGYTKQDRKKYGRPKPYPCPMWAIRLTLPNMFHGSTKTTPNQRRVLYPWHTAISEDHLTLEIPGQHDWEEVARCHRDLEAPLRGVGGDAVTKDRPPFRFPAAVPMESSSALCDALIGRRKWNDPVVIMEAQLVLGKDDEAAMKYMNETKKKLVDNYLRCVAKVREIEPLVFPDNSYVLQSQQR